MKNYLTHQTPLSYYWNTRSPFPHYSLLRSYNSVSSAIFTARPPIPISMDSESISVSTVLSIISGHCPDHQSFTQSDCSTDHFYSDLSLNMYEYFSRIISARICDDVISLQESGVTDTFPSYFYDTDFQEYLSYLYLGHEVKLLSCDTYNMYSDRNCLLVIDSLFSFINSYQSHFSTSVTSRDFERVHNSFISDALFQTNELFLYSEASDDVPLWKRELYIGISSSVVCYPHSIPIYSYLDISSIVSVSDVSSTISKRVITVTIPYLGPTNDWNSIINSSIEPAYYPYRKVFTVHPYLEVYTHEVVWQRLGYRPDPALLFEACNSFTLIPGCRRVLEEFIYRYCSYEMISTLALEAATRMGLDISSLPKCSTETQAKFLNKLSKLLFHFRYPLNIISYLNGTPFLLNSNLFSDYYRSSQWDCIEKCSDSQLDDPVYTGDELFNYYISEYSQCPSSKYDPTSDNLAPTPFTEQYIQEIGIPLYATYDAEVALNRVVNSTELQERQVNVFEPSNRFNNLKLNSYTTYSVFIHGLHLSSMRSKSAEDQMMQTITNQEVSRSELAKIKKKDTDDTYLRDFLIENGTVRYDSFDDNDDRDYSEVIELLQFEFSYDQTKRSLAIPAYKFTNIDGSYYYDDLACYVNSNSNTTSIQSWNKNSKEDVDLLSSTSNKLLTRLHNSMNDSDAYSLVNKIVNEIKRVNIERTMLGNLKIKYIPEFSVSPVSETGGKFTLHENRVEVLIISARYGEYKFNSCIIEYDIDNQYHEVVSSQPNFATCNESTGYSELNPENQNSSSSNSSYNAIASRNNEDLVMASPYTTVSSTLRRLFYNVVEIVTSEWCSGECITTRVDGSNEECNLKYNKMLIIDIDSPSIMFVLVKFQNAPYTIQDFITAYTATCLEINTDHKLSAKFMIMTELDPSTELISEEWESEDSMVNRLLSKAMKFAQFTRICIQLRERRLQSSNN